MSQPDDQVSDGWLCDRGRYAIGFIKSEERLRTPMLRRRDELIQISWDDAIGMWAQALREAGGGQRIAALGGGELTNEEAYLYQYIMRHLGTPHLDWRVGRQQQVLTGALTGTLEELEQAQVIVTIGVPPSKMRRFLIYVSVKPLPNTALVS